MNTKMSAPETSLKRSLFLNRAMVIRLALITELSLIAASLIWIWLADLSVPYSLNSNDLLYGVYCCIPMLAVNMIVFGYLSRENSPYPVYGKFKRTIVIPLCGNLNVWSAFVLALFSGFAEEFFFRGAFFAHLQLNASTTVSACIVSAIFSYIHFIGVVREYWQITIFYFLFGLYFCAIMLATNNLIAPIVTHALYNFAAILYLRYIEAPKLLKAQEIAPKTT